MRASWGCVPVSGRGVGWELLLSVSRRQRRHRPAVRSTRSHRPQLLSAARLANHHRLRRLRRVPRQRRAPSPARPRRLSIFSAGGRARLAAHSCPPSSPPPAPSPGSARPPPPPYWPSPRALPTPPLPSAASPPLPSLPRAPRSGLRLTSSCCWGAGGRRSPAQRRGKEKELAESGARDSEPSVGAMEVRGEEQPLPSTPGFLFPLDTGFLFPCCPGRGVSSPAPVFAPILCVSSRLSLFSGLGAASPVPRHRLQKVPFLAQAQAF